MVTTKGVRLEFMRLAILGALALGVLTGCGGGHGGGGGNPKPGILVNPANLSFGDQLIGSSSPAQVVTVTNSGNVSVSVPTVSVTGSNATYFSQTNTCSAPVAPNGSCTVNVVFAPREVGVATAQLALVTSAGSETIVPLAGKGTGGVASLSPSSLSFGSQALGTASASQIVTVTNSGDAPLNITAVAVGGTDATSFSQTNTCGAPVTPGGTCTAAVTFAPTTAGNKVATLGLTLATGSSPQIPLSGVGVTAPVATVNPSSVAFGDQVINTASPPQVVVVTNTGTAPLVIGSVGISGPGAALFSQTNNCSASIAVGSACSINVVFTPTASGPAAASLTIGTNGPTNPAVALTGTGAAVTPPIQPTVPVLTPGTLTFGNQLTGSASAPQTIDVANRGPVPVSISSIVVSGSSSFVQSNNCGASIASGGSCAVSITFTPATTGDQSAVLTVNNDSGTNPTARLTGSGTAPDVAVSPTGLVFGSQAMGTSSAAQAITVSNRGSAALTVSSVGVAGKDAASFVQTNNCGAPIAPGASCTVNVVFKPVTSGSLSASVVLNTNAGRNPAVALSGTGTGFTIGGSVFGLVSGTEVTIYNNGADALTVKGNGAFVFPTPVPYNGAYTVTIPTQPEGQYCTVFNGSGTGVTANVSNVTLNCKTLVKFYDVGGSVSGLLPGAQMTVTCGPKHSLLVNANGRFAFPYPISELDCSVVDIAVQPVGQPACQISNNVLGASPDVNAIIDCAAGSPPTHVYVANSAGSSVSQYSIGPAGSLVPLNPPTAATGQAPRAVVVDSTNAYAYVLNAGDGTISQFSIGTTGALQALNPATVPVGQGANAMIASPGGPYVYVTNASGRNIAQFKIGAGGSLAAMNPATVPMMQASGFGGLSADTYGATVYYAADFISQYSAVSGGALVATQNTAFFNGYPGLPHSIAAGVAVDPTGNYLYVTYDAAKSVGGGTYASVAAVAGYAIGNGGVLTPFSGGNDFVPNLYALGNFTTARFIGVEPKGRCAYVVYGATGAGDSLVMAIAVGLDFPAGGGLCGGTSTSPIPAGSYANAIAFDPLGIYAYVTDRDGNSVTQYRILASGELAPNSPSTVATGSSPVAIAVTH